jgi:hypothetical protein
VYTLPVTTLILVIALSLLAPMAGLASGAGEGPKPPAFTDVPLHLFVLAESEGDGNRMFTDRVSLPDSISLARWTSFTFLEGKVKTKTEQSWSLRSKKMISQETSRGVLVLGYDVVVAVAAAKGAAPAGSTVDVSFSVKDCLNEKGDVLYQPARMAVIHAVSQGRKKSGEARVVEISYTAPGSFGARVELR